MLNEIYNYIDKDLKISHDIDNNMIYIHTTTPNWEKTDWSDIRNYLRTINYKLGFILIH